MSSLFNITQGLPYRRVIRVEKAATIWPDTDAVEVRAQVRKNKSVTSDLVFDFTPYLTLVFDGTDIVITLIMAGEQTMDVRSGHVDFILSDPGATDDRAKRILLTTVSVDSLITSPQ